MKKCWIGPVMKQYQTWLRQAQRADLGRNEAACWELEQNHPCARKGGQSLILLPDAIASPVQVQRRTTRLSTEVLSPS